MAENGTGCRLINDRRPSFFGSESGKKIYFSFFDQTRISKNIHN